MKQINVTVIGKVQGVYFRASTKDLATKLKLSGFVKNLQNGDVYLEASGEEKQIQQLLDWLKTGPATARVDSLKIEEGNQQHHKQIDGFDVQR